MNNQNILFSEFIYDNRRICAKIYILFKFLGLIFYSATLLTCYNPYFYIGMITVMFLSIINLARYEYAHFKRYGTTFSSWNEYQIWKRQLYPNSKLFFSMIELSIKTAYFIQSFPPQFDYENLCGIGETIFNLHIFSLLIIYSIIAIFSFFIICVIYCNPRPVRQQEPIHLLIPIIINNNQTEECCICLDTDNIRAWSILPCGHKFHWECVSTWIRSNKTCPVCRHNVIPIL